MIQIPKYLIVRFGDTIYTAKRRYLIEQIEANKIRHLSFRSIEDVAAYMVNRVGEDAAREYLEDMVTIDII